LLIVDVVIDSYSSDGHHILNAYSNPKSYLGQLVCNTLLLVASKVLDRISLIIISILTSGSGLSLFSLLETQFLVDFKQLSQTIYLWVSAAFLCSTGMAENWQSKSNKKLRKDVQNSIAFSFSKCFRSDLSSNFS